ncbi:MAG: hypothetical protein QOJ03_3284, partial [Frankiaceae bacterium]|nr:hypothetical protein [Frankiaceae bacterium]
MRRYVAFLSATALATAVVVPVAFAGHGKGSKPARYLVGGAAESINPTAAMLANQDFYLGGYGFGSGHPGNVTALPSATGGRFATGILGDGAHSRAFAVGDAKSTIVLAQIETQGFFNAYKQGPFGENEIRQDAATQIASLAAAASHDKHHSAAPAPTASQIVVDSDHSHGGPDTAGVWGGV